MDNCPRCKSDCTEWVDYPITLGDNKVLLKLKCVVCATTWEDTYKRVEVKHE